jgi:hypothetical protein
MPTFLSDPSPTLYAILAIMVLALVALWFRGRKRGDLIRLTAGVAILAAVALIDYFVESPREESTRKTEEIRAATAAKNINDVAKHISESFSYQGKNKAWLLDKARIAYQYPEFAGVGMSGFSRAEFKTIDSEKIQIGFEAWLNGFPLGNNFRFYVWATYVKDPDGQFRMQTFDLFEGSKRPSVDQKPIVPDQLR